MSQSNPIRETIVARLKALSASSDALESVPHAATRGEVREDYLVEFFADIIPAGLRIKKGLICDSEGRTTKQTDFIVFDPAILPAVTLSGNVGVIPIESVHLQAEIKTQIDSATLTQVHEQIQALRMLQVAHHGPVEVVGNIIVPTVILGYRSSVALHNLREWLSDSQARPNLVALCVLGDYSLFRTGPDTVIVYEATSGDPLFPTLRFVHNLYDVLLDVAERRRNFRADWRQYLERRD